MDAQLHDTFDDGPRPGSARIPSFRPPSPQPAPPMAPVPVIPPGRLAQRGARVLDSDTAVRTTGSRLDPTVYLTGRLLVRGVPGRSADAIVSSLQAWSDSQGHDLDWSIAPNWAATAKLNQGETGALLDEVLHTAVDITARNGAPARPPDAWTLLQQARFTFRDERSLGDALALDHLMSAGGSDGAPTWSGVGGMWAGVGGMWAGVGGAPGGPDRALGTRLPVVWSAPDPRTTLPGGSDAEHAPVVAVLDNGIGPHAWFAEEGDGFTRFRGSGTDAEVVALLDDPGTAPAGPGQSLNGRLDPLAGHGTFVAGIVRQRCPRAHLLDVPVMAADGTVAESDVLLALGELLRGHHEDAVPLSPGDAAPRRRLDVVNLSMGYYHESPGDPAAAAPLALVLEAFAADGVSVVAAAGNGATTTPFYPAALSSRLDGTPPLVGVGALTPDSRTVAAFSNHGPWVSALAPGTAVVSTVPVSLQGSRHRGLEVTREDRMPRGTIDPDDFSAGFAVWSGTSFAAPWIAGEIAAATRRPGGAAGAVTTVLDARRKQLVQLHQPRAERLDAVFAGSTGQETP